MVKVVILKMFRFCFSGNSGLFVGLLVGLGMIACYLVWVYAFR